MKNPLVTYICVGALSLVLMVSLLAFPKWQTEWQTATVVDSSTLLAYNIDLEMDEARKEKTVEHYGEGIRDIVEDATDNNVNNPDSKPTAQSTYERESPLNDLLPEQIGKDFSKEDLADMENSD
ncbi:MAG: hypothetical protein WBA76_15750 [Phormidesmis sp.]